MTVLIGHDGAIRLLAQCDWPLSSLLADRGARAAYRVTTSSAGRLRVEGRQDHHRCLVESTTPVETARLLLGR